MEEKIAFHFDQNVRDSIRRNSDYKRKIESLLYEKDYQEVMLPFSTLEYAGISAKKTIFKDLNIPEEFLKSLDIPKMKEWVEDEIRKRIPRDLIIGKLKDKLRNKNKESLHYLKWTKPFLERHITYFSEDNYKGSNYFYEVIIARLSWDKISKIPWMKYANDVGKNKIRQLYYQLSYLAVKEQLYILKVAVTFDGISRDSIQEDPNIKNEAKDFAKKVSFMISNMGMKPDADLGDSEFIHVAINGQYVLGNPQKRRMVYCFTEDNEKDVKKKLIACHAFYNTLESIQFRPFYKHDSSYSGTIYIVDKKGNVKEEIKTSDWTARNTYKKFCERDKEFLALYEP